MGPTWTNLDSFDALCSQPAVRMSTSCNLIICIIKFLLNSNVYKILPFFFSRTSQETY